VGKSVLIWVKNGNPWAINLFIRAGWGTEEFFMGLQFFLLKDFFFGALGAFTFLAANFLAELLLGT